VPGGLGVVEAGPIARLAAAGIPQDQAVAAVLIQRFFTAYLLPVWDWGKFHALFGDFRDHRQPGSPEVQPVYQDGQIVRFTNDPPAGIPPDGQPWNGTRVLYLMHPSDPVVWWSPDLIFREPDWISQPPGRDVLGAMFWVPFVTFWLVTADLPFAASVPAGHGHVYTTEFADGWNAVLRPAGITPAELATLRGMIANGG